MEVTAAKNPQSQQTFEKFARVKFTELKAKFPQKTDKDIFSMVNKQWQTQSKTQRQSSISSVKMETNLIQDENEVIIPKKLEYQQEQKKEERKKEQIKEESENISIKSTPMKSTPVKSIKKKVIKKSSKGPTQYNTFYKSYYSRLHNEHPRWTREQIKKIVNLLWRRLLQKKSGKKNRLTKRQPVFKKKSGKVYFAQIKRKQGMNNQQISKLWKSFPAETKKYFGLLGEGKSLNQSPAKSAGTTILTFQSRIPSNRSHNNLGFLHKSL